MWKRSKVLILGGTGLIGSHFVEELIKKQADVTITLHNRSNHFGDKVNTVLADLTIAEACQKIINDWDYVIHAAAQSGGLGRNQNDPLSTLIPNARMNLNILESIEMNPPEVFHFSSNNSMYPDVNYPVKEDEISIPAYGISSHYSQIKILGENHCRYLYEKKGIKISITRGGNSYGKYDNFDPVTSHTIPANIRKVVEKQSPIIVWSDGEALRDYTHARDIAKGSLLAMEKHPYADPINIATGKATSVIELINLICSIDGFENAEIKYDQTKPGGPRSKLLDNEKAKKMLNFEPEISLEEGLRETISWYKKSQS